MSLFNELCNSLSFDITLFSDGIKNVARVVKGGGSWSWTWKVCWRTPILLDRLSAFAFTASCNWVNQSAIFYKSH